MAAAYRTPDVRHLSCTARVELSPTDSPALAVLQTIPAGLSMELVPVELGAEASR